MPNESSIIDPRNLRIAAVVVAVTGLVFAFFQDTWMIAASVTLSGGLFLLANGESENDDRQRRFGYLGLVLAGLFMVIDLLVAASAAFG